MWHDVLASGLLTLCELFEACRDDEKLWRAELPASDPIPTEQPASPTPALADAVPPGNPADNDRLPFATGAPKESTPFERATPIGMARDARDCCWPGCPSVAGRLPAADRARRVPQNADPVALSTTPRNLRSKTPSSADSADGAMGSTRRLTQGATFTSNSQLLLLGMLRGDGKGAGPPPPPSSG